MAARLDSVARYIAECGRWQVSNLQLQKVMFMAQMMHMGTHDGQRLVDAGFEAWDYGPVAPELYKKVRMFGSSPVKDVFYDARPFRADDVRRHILDEVCEKLLPLRPGALVDMTHWSEGAWAKNYVPGSRGIPIPDADIADEYRKRIERQFELDSKAY